MSRLVRFAFVVVFVLASLPALPAMAATCTWTGASNTDWATPGNWNTCGGGVPGVLDSATVGWANNQPTLAANTTIANLTINSSSTLTINSGATLSVSGAAVLNGTIGGNGNLTINGNMNWSGGTMSGSGVTTIAPGGTLLISGSWHDLDGRTLNQGGTATWTGTGTIDLSNGALINNQAGASLEAQDNGRMYFGGSGATPAFNNAGLFRKAIASGTTRFSNVPLNNTGTVKIESGELQFNNFVQTAGDTVLNGGNLACFNPINIQGGILAGTGTVDADIVNAGHIVPGGSASPGNIVVTGDYIQTAAGSLDLDIGGLTAVTQYDRLDIEGEATINGRLNVALINGYIPTVRGTSFRVMNYDSHTGAFVTTTGMAIGGGKYLLPIYTSDHMIVVLPYQNYLPVILR